MVTHFSFGSYDGYEISNGLIKARVISYGARLANLFFDDKDMILGYDQPEDFETGGIYSGATIGRYANRISGGAFTIRGKKYEIPKNEEGITSLHGGTKGFDQFHWESEIVSENSVRFFRVSPDGEMGFPGNLEISVTYTLIESALELSYSATTDQDTHVSLTNHAYFNLDGYHGEDCTKMHLSLKAPWYLPVDEKLIPNGEIKSVSGTRFDFTSDRAIAEDYDHCFVFGNERIYQNVGTLYSENSKISMDIETDLPAIQFYTMPKCDETSGKDGVPFHIHHAVALETQFFPDSPNHPNFPSTLLHNGETWTSVTRYIFKKN